jgi:hypothetical protein
MSSQGINSEVTICNDCGITVDVRALREKDTGGGVEPPVSETEIQAYAKAAKAREIREESGELDALPVTIKHPTEEEVAAALKSKAHLITPADPPRTDQAPCVKRGGEVPECDTGRGKAHHCVNGKWGKRGVFSGPCGCPCHSWTDA